MVSPTTCTGILLTNLGTPDAPTSKALRRYLGEFLSDPQVVKLPRWLWLPFLYMLILPLRSRYSAKLYQKIWTKHGSPLLYYTRLQQIGLQALLEITWPEQPVKVAMGMRYGEPGIAAALAELKQAGVNRIILLPLYPQYADATTGSTLIAVDQALQHWRVKPELQVIRHYADHPLYVTTWAEHIKRHWQATKPGEKLLFSFHGLPERSLADGDPYFSLCHQTAHLVAAELALPKDRWQVVFQSRFGKAEWLKPYCADTLRLLAAQGVREVDIVCPGFSADCLETLEEIALKNRALFLSAGGQRFNYIPALNDSAEHLSVLAGLISPLLSFPPQHSS